MLHSESLDLHSPSMHLKGSSAEQFDIPAHSYKVTTQTPVEQSRGLLFGQPL